MTIEDLIYNILANNLSKSCLNEVDAELINELQNSNGIDVWTILNDWLSNTALDELEYETNGLNELTEYLNKKDK